MLIGEVAERTGISARMLRHYDRIGVVTPSQRTASGYRSYGAGDLRRLFEVEALRSLGLSLREIAEVLGGAGLAPSALVDQLADRARERIDREQELLRTLDRVRAGEPEEWSDVLRTVALLRGLESPSPSARLRLALSLADADGDHLRMLAEAALAEPDPTVAGTLQWALARSGDAAVPLLHDALRSADAERRVRAAEALVKIDTGLATRTVATALDDADPRVARRAVVAAARLGDPRAIPPLVRLVLDGGDDREVAALLRGLGAEWGLADRVDRALGDALATADPAQRLRLIAVLAEIPGDLSRRRLAALVGDDDRRVGLAARFALETAEGRG